MSTYKTEQENFWAGDFGVDYIERNNSDASVASRVTLWSQMLRSADTITSARELGCNIGINLRALNRLRPDIALSAYEINETAAEQARQTCTVRGGVHCSSILEPIGDEPVDLTFTSGVLIHINPDYLKNIYDNLVGGSNRYVLVCEYYNPTPVAVSYRGHDNKLFKRDFAGELIDRYDLTLVDYGFAYHGDQRFEVPQDDPTWFLLEKGNKV